MPSEFLLLQHLRDLETKFRNRLKPHPAGADFHPPEREAPGGPLQSEAAAPELEMLKTTRKTHAKFIPVR